MNRCLLLLVLPLLACLAACGSSPAPSTLSLSSTPTKGPYHLGQTVPVPGWQITIANARMETKIGLMAPAQERDRFLVLQVTLRNTSDAAAIASDTPFFCLGADGTKYPLVAAGTPSIDGAVAAGHAAAGQVTYEVPASARQFTIHYEDDAGAVLATWQFSV